MSNDDDEPTSPNYSLVHSSNSPFRGEFLKLKAVEQNGKCVCRNEPVRNSYFNAKETVT